MLKVVFLDFVFERRELIQLEDCELEILPPAGDPQRIIEVAREADVLLLRDQFSRVTREVLEGLPRLKLLVTRSTGYDHIDLQAAKDRGVVVCNVPDYGAHAIAEHAFALMLAVARNVCTGNERYRRSKRFDDSGLAGVELFGKTLGVIGTGRIGRHAIRIGQGFAMKVVAHDAFPNPDLASQLGFAYLDLPHLLARADFLTIHVPLSEGTHHLINADTLGHLKPGAILVNASRGPVVDTEALKVALASGHLLGAGLDVLEDERGRYHEFADLNVVITPHVGWYTREVKDRLVTISLDNVRAWRQGHPINRVV